MLKMIFGFLLVAMAVNAYAEEYDVGKTIGLSSFSDNGTIYYAKSYIHVVYVRGGNEEGITLRIYMQPQGCPEEEFKLMNSIIIDNPDKLIKMLNESLVFKFNEEDKNSIESQYIGEFNNNLSIGNNPEWYKETYIQEFTLDYISSKVNWFIYKKRFTELSFGLYTRDRAFIVNEEELISLLKTAIQY